MVRAVSSVAVAISMPVWRTNSAPYCSRPQDFGRLAAIIRIGEQSIEQRGIHCARASSLAIAIERRRHGIHHHVARSGVEGDHVFRRCIGRNHRDVRDAADVERDARMLGMPEKLIVEERHQRRAFAAGRHVAGTKIGDGLDAGALGNHRRLADLHRARDLAAAEIPPARLRGKSSARANRSARSFRAARRSS